MKIISKFRWQLLGIVGVIAIILPRPLLAQGEKTDLTLTLSPIGYYNELKVGEENKLFLEVRNTGNTTITHIRLSSQGPKDWIIEFNPGEIASLTAGNFQTVDLIVKPDSKATKGGYNITLIAEANEVRRAETVWLNVKSSSSLWLWIGAIIGTVVVAIFVFIFVHFGRR